MFTTRCIITYRLKSYIFRIYLSDIGLNTKWINCDEVK